jgi:ATPase subunit of ABC transporter with duplicated ATPase domains
VFRRLAAPSSARSGPAPAPSRSGAASSPRRSGAAAAPGPTGGLSPVEARTLLAKFRIGADVVLRPADTLSPGERTRAGLALFQARGSTCLILDEPTNHLDLPAIEQLEQALTSYQGTLLLVTHDRRLAATVAITREIDVTHLHAR